MADIFDEEVESIFGNVDDPDDETPSTFDEKAYLRANPDVAQAIAMGLFKSAYMHYSLHGEREKRPLRPSSEETRDQVILIETTVGPASLPSEFRASIEAVVLSPNGVLLVGWVDDAVDGVEWIRVSGTSWRMTLSESLTARVRRTDVEAAIATTRIHPFGFFSFAYIAEIVDTTGGCRVLVHLKDGREMGFDVQPRRVTNIELRNTVLGYISSAEVFGNRHVQLSRMVQGALCDAIVNHNLAITREITSGAYVERFGPRIAKPRGSIVVCLYGKSEYLFLQNALFSRGAGFSEYELIYISNSPEMAEQLMKDMRTCTLLYGLSQTLIILPGNAGFGAANNVAVHYAQSDRILIVNPDVFPRDHDWARKHTQVICGLPEEQTRIFGAPLYYDDGSLMHGGMYFEFDTGLTVGAKGMVANRLMRVEHYGKGSPNWLDVFTRSRPVPAVGGAFISASRDWYEKLGGFTEDFVFGHYEDADLCLKSISAGTPPWIHDIRLWHLEGKGSTRLPVHEGGSYVNRALFSERWGDFISKGLEGPNPTHPILRSPTASSPNKSPTDAQSKEAASLKPVPPAGVARSRPVERPLSRSASRKVR